MLAADKLREPVSLDVDPFSDAVLADPYAFFETMREASPVVYFPQYDLYGVGRHAEAEVVASDWERFTSIHGMAMNDLRSPDAWRTASPISESDPPDHTVIRKAMNRILSPAVLRSWKATFTEAADRIVADVTARDTFDGVSDLVERFVLQVFPDVLGVEIPREAFLLVGEMNFNQMGPNNARTKASVDAVAPILPIYEASFQRDNVVPGGFAEQIFLAEEAGNIPKGLAALLVRSFIRGGTDTSISGLGFTFNQLAQNPDEYALVRSDPGKVVAAFDEAIRHEAPAQVVFRTVRDDTELGGVALKGDKKIAYFMGAANRDPRKFDDPDAYRIGRNSVGIHLALGRGIHVCIGQMIVRLEADCLLNAFARAVKRFEPAAPPTYRPVNAMRTLDSLPLRITERA
jgi:4-methoxybenzoate monooxygenase (O-demethylating)